MNDLSPTPCPGCRIVLRPSDGPTHAYIGASAACWERWGEFEMLALSDDRLGQVLPTAVDAYAAQHPGVPSRRSAQSVVAHLVSLHLVLEGGWRSVDGIRAKQVLLARDPVFDWLEPPADLGLQTVLDLAAAHPGARSAAVMAYAAAVWASWGEHHAAIHRIAAPVVKRMNGG